MKRMIRSTCYLLLLFLLLPIVSGCNNEDDVIEIFTKKTWKLSRLTIKDSSAQFYPGLWSSDEAKENSLNALKQDGTFTLNFNGSELNGELLDTTLEGKGIRATFEGTWTADGESNSLGISMRVSGSETDPLADAFIKGLRNVYKYEGDSNSLTLYFNDGQTTKIMGFTHQR